MAEINEYTIKNDTRFKYSLPNIGGTSLTSLALGLGVGVAVGAISILTGGLAIGVGVGVGSSVAVASGVGAQFTMSGINYLDNFSKSHFAKKEKEQGIEAVCSEIEYSAQEARYIDCMLQLQPNSNKIEYQGEMYSRRKLQKLIKRHQTVSYYGVKYQLGKALKYTDIINSLQNKKDRTAEQNVLLEDSLKQLSIIRKNLQLTNWGKRDTENFVESNGTYTPSTSPYKKLLIDAIRKGCLLGSNAQINNNIFKLRYNLIDETDNFNSAVKMYSEIYEKPMYSAINNFQQERNRALEEVNEEHEKLLQLIEKLINNDAKTLKLTREEALLKDQIENLTDYIALIKQAEVLKPKMTNKMAKHKKQLVWTVNSLKNAIVNKDESQMKGQSILLQKEISVISKMIDEYNKDLGRNEIKAEYDIIINLTKDSLDTTANMLITSLNQYSKKDKELAKELEMLTNYRSKSNLNANELTNYNNLLQKVANKLRLLYADQVSKNSDMSKKLDKATLTIEALRIEDATLAKTIKGLRKNQEELKLRLKALGKRVVEQKGVTEQEKQRLANFEVWTNESLTTLNNTIKHLNFVGDMKSMTIDGLQEKLVETADKLAETKNEVQVVEANLEQTKRERDTANKQKQGLRKQVGSMKAQIVKDSQTISTLQDENDGLQVLVEELEGENRKNSTTIKNQKGVINSQKAQADIRKRQLADTKKKSAEKDEIINFQEFMIEQLNDNITSLNEDLNAQLDVNSGLREDLNIAHTKITELNKSNSEIVDELHKTSKELEMLYISIEQGISNKRNNLQEGRARSDLSKKMAQISAHISQVATDVQSGKITSATKLMAIIDGTDAIQQVLLMTPSREDRKNMSIDQIKQMKETLDRVYQENSKGWPKYVGKIEDRSSTYKIDLKGFER